MPQTKAKDRDLTLPEFDPIKHYPSWTDMLGVEYRPGDVVVVAITVGKSASMTIGMVKRINRLDSEGKEIRDYRTGKLSCNLTLTPLIDSTNRRRRWSDKDSTILLTEKVIRLDTTVQEILDRAESIGK
jgi:hypothetical protein